MDQPARAEPDEYRQHRFTPPPGAADVLLVRHGESQPASPDAEFPMRDGHADPPLDAVGHVEAQALAERLASEEVSAIYVTPLQRTAQTAAPLAERLGLLPRVAADLREVHLGEWEGARFRINVRRGHPIAQRVFDEERWDVIPGAEATDAFAARVRGGMGGIGAAHPDQRVAVFTHGGVIGMVVALATGGRPFAFIGADNASITHLVVAGDTWILRRFNDTAHLGTDLDRPVQPLT
ncbi:MAG: histidine phosphatase family protein [Euzebyales bacterium]|nr:histidine phosphatase family protein [Euzebyales bacterium]MBA3621189.1 histidine phosphatase family protein [Euzebyales bacterium]